MKGLYAKFDLFMELYILPKFNPESIRWVFSISGGKDSFAMCDVVHDWYMHNSYRINAMGIHIWQWGNEFPDLRISDNLPWLERCRIIDARELTNNSIHYVDKSQAPCHSCATVRHTVSDQLLKEIGTELPVFLCRGLHLSDVAISILWRLFWNANEYSFSNKGLPIIELSQNQYLVKPLCFAREYECQEYSKYKHYVLYSCDCPMTTFPSRRDIVEESIRLFYKSYLWEFDIPYVTTYLESNAKLSSYNIIKELSLEGIEKKNNSLPDDFFEYVLERLKEKVANNKNAEMLPQIDLIGYNLLKKGKTVNSPHSILYTCKFFANPMSLTDFDRRMIATLGPFWGACALPLSEKEYYWQLQNKIFDIKLDKSWSQVEYWLKKYYAYKSNEKNK